MHAQVLAHKAHRLSSCQSSSHISENTSSCNWQVPARRSITKVHMHCEAQTVFASKVPPGTQEGCFVKQCRAQPTSLEEVNHNITEEGCIRETANHIVPLDCHCIARLAHITGYCQAQTAGTSGLQPQMRVTSLRRAALMSCPRGSTTSSTSM